MRGFCAWLLGAALVTSAALAQSSMPAEEPPADFAGQQYVDSKGCTFVRAGDGTKVLWIPRVSRDGAQVCGYPPSGRRVPVVEDVGAQLVPEGSNEVASVAAATDSGVAEMGGYFVAVGSFSLSANADRAQLELGKLNYRVVRGLVQGGSGSLITVFAGPFADASEAEAARVVLRKNGFPDATLIRP